MPTIERLERELEEMRALERELRHARVLRDAVSGRKDDGVWLVVSGGEGHLDPRVSRELLAMLTEYAERKEQEYDARVRAMILSEDPDA